jgi:hypothetical protein
MEREYIYEIYYNDMPLLFVSACTKYHALDIAFYKLCLAIDQLDKSKIKSVKRH